MLDFLNPLTKDYFHSENGQHIFYPSIFNTSLQGYILSSAEEKSRLHNRINLIHLLGILAIGFTLYFSKIGAIFVAVVAFALLRIHNRLCVMRLQKSDRPKIDFTAVLPIDPAKLPSKIFIYSVLIVGISQFIFSLLVFSKDPTHSILGIIVFGFMTFIGFRLLKLKNQPPQKNADETPPPN